MAGGLALPVDLGEAVHRLMAGTPTAADRSLNALRVATTHRRLCEPRIGALSRKFKHPPKIGWLVRRERCSVSVLRSHYACIAQ